MTSQIPGRLAGERPAPGPDPEPGGSGVRIRWWGNNAWELSFADTTVLIDPWVTRFPTGVYTAAGTDPDTPLSWDEPLIAACFPRADLVLLTHGHFDHITDVPVVAARTGATVVGTESHLNLLRALDVPDDQLATVRGGEYYQYDGFTVQVLHSVHSALGARRQVPFPGTRPGSIPQRPRVVSDLVEGEMLAYSITIGEHLRVLNLGSANFIAAQLEGLRPDVVFVPTGGANVYNYVGRLMSILDRPRFVLPTHWDDIDLPLSAPAADTGGLAALRSAIAATSPRSQFVQLEHEGVFVP